MPSLSRPHHSIRLFIMEVLPYGLVSVRLDISYYIYKLASYATPVSTIASANSFETPVINALNNSLMGIYKAFIIMAAMARPAAKAEVANPTLPPTAASWSGTFW